MSISALLEELRKDRKIRDKFLEEIILEIIMRLVLDKDLRISL